MINQILAAPNILTIWVGLLLLSIIFLILDLFYYNDHLSSMMKWVWILTILYSGPVGLLIYYYSGRKQIPKDTLWRKGFRSVAHCYSGCGAGEIAGIFIAVGLLSLANIWVAVITFILAYAAGYAMTVGPLLQEGVSFSVALKDALYTETASITVMEVTAISIDLALAKNAGISETLFWSSLIVSLCAGLIAAYPVNVLLVRFGVKKGMHNPKKTHH